MKWIVLAIIACLIPYTWITLHYRKENPAYEPYQDTKDRAQVIRLLESGYQRIDVRFERLVEPAVPPSPAATTERIAGGVPSLLRDALIDQPPVPSAFENVSAPSETLAGSPYSFEIACVQPNHGERPVGSVLYLRGSEAVFMIGYDALPGDLQSRDLAVLARIIVPAHALEPGRYHATLVGARESRRWTFTVH
ncbi:hypothetical protein [Synoicihabitans lomoniglobus]|uniref:Uncharacterized protein n=1 Tax=Synoicihabitans lomoniglobus TaxID=2909285 RepID=A0AAF0I881_9BACT|nr:hypothetical protein [Opitutaceae bacterium LMO-M01]WED67441.1 hypothetical protein PXH66_11330 [Opitutaceae bacterium LMO-M01]